jgi:hypothetical protein
VNPPVPPTPDLGVTLSRRTFGFWIIDQYDSGDYF